MRFIWTCILPLFKASGGKEPFTLDENTSSSFSSSYVKTTKIIEFSPTKVGSTSIVVVAATQKMNVCTSVKNQKLVSQYYYQRLIIQIMLLYGQLS